MAQATANDSTDNREQEQQGDIMETLQELTTDELKDRIRSRNQEQGVESGDDEYVPLSGRKDELVERVASFETAQQGDEEPQEEASEESEESDMHEVAMHANVEERSYEELELGQILQNPRNPRRSGDYYDPSLQDKIDREGGLLGSMTVAPTGEYDDQGREIHHVLSGNRRLANLQQVVSERWDEDADTYIVGCDVRLTNGDDKAVRFDEMATIVNANEGQLPLSPVGKFEAMQAMLDEEGVTYDDVADALDVSVPYISNMMKLRYVPDNILNHVHYGANAEHFEKNFSAEEMEANGIPFEIRDTPTDEGIETRVLGINLNSALEVATLWRKISKDHRKKLGDAYDEDEIRSEFEEFINDSEKSYSYRGKEGQGVIGAAVHMSTNQFKSWFKEAAEDWGLIETDEPEEQRVGTGSVDLTGDEEPAPDQGDSEGAEASDTGSEPDLSGGDDVDPLDEFKGHSEAMEAIANELEEHDLILSQDWEKKLADEIRMGDGRANQAVNFLIDIGVIIEA